MQKRASRLGSLTTFVVLAVVTYLYATPDELEILGYCLLSLLSSKLALAMFYTPYDSSRRANRRRSDRETRAPAGNEDVAVIVPIYNEDPEILRRCLMTLLDQRRPPRTVMVVDDGSSSQEAADLADTLAGRFADRGIRLLVLRQPRNMGKREALARGFMTAPNADVYVGVDSDTVLDRDALAELLVPMADERVTGVTGMVLASNYRVNILTRLIELRYANAFLYERAAYSMLGTVLCCCGSLAAYRGRVVHKYLDDFRTQTFLGRPAVVGDDRRLTNYCLLEGKVLLQTSALAETAVPERLGHYLRQQSRWNRSFFRETMWCLKTFPFRRPMGFILSSIEFLSWIAFTTMLVYSLAVYPAMHGEMIFDDYAITLVMFGYLRSVRYLDLPRPGVGILEKLGVFSLAPMYGLMHIFMLLPVRLWSLATLRTAAWGTRSAVEVSAERHPATNGHVEPAGQLLPGAERSITMAEPRMPMAVPAEPPEHRPRRPREPLRHAAASARLDGPPDTPSAPRAAVPPEHDPRVAAALRQHDLLMAAFSGPQPGPKDGIGPVDDTRAVVPPHGATRPPERHDHPGLPARHSHSGPTIPPSRPGLPGSHRFSGPPVPHPSPPAPHPSPPMPHLLPAGPALVAPVPSVAPAPPVPAPHRPPASAGTASPYGPPMYEPAAPGLAARETSDGVLPPPVPSSDHEDLAYWDTIRRDLGT